MNLYRSYMDRITVSPGFHQRLLDQLDIARRTRTAPRRPYLRYGTLAACCALAVVVGWGAQNAALPSPTPSSTGSVQRSPAPIPNVEQRYTLTVSEPPAEQTYSFPCIPAITFTDCTNASQISADIALPKGHFTEKLNAQEIIRCVGGGEQVPWMLCWEHFGLDGNVIYDGAGQVWQANLYGEREDACFTLTLAPGSIPIRDVIFDVDTLDYDGLPVTAWYQSGDRDDDGTEESVYGLEFMSGNTGVHFVCVSQEQDTAAWLAAVLLRSATLPNSQFTTDFLVPEEIPDWRSEELTCAQAYAEDLSPWLPNAPAGYGFESAWREVGQERDWLTVSWTRGYDHVHVTVSRYTAHQDIPEADFNPGELTAQTLQDWGRYEDHDAGDLPGWRYPSFTVVYSQPDHTAILVRCSIKGLTPDQAAALFSSDQSVQTLP